MKAAGRKPSGSTIENLNDTNHTPTPDGSRRSAPIMHTDPLAYFITWTCYGTWLPGDERGWTKWHKGNRIPQPLLADWCKEQMVETPIVLDATQRAIVEAVITGHCELREWHLHAVNCRSNHCHVVVTASEHTGEIVRDQLKAWSTRKLKDHESKRQGASPPVAHQSKRQGASPPVTEVRQHWWTRKGSVRYLFDDDSLGAAVSYTLEAQDAGGSKSG